MYESGDVLLFALSAWGTTSWSAFKRCFDELHRVQVVRGESDEESKAALLRGRTLRILGSLGHVDVAFAHGVGRIVIAPPLLAVLPGAGVRRAILCGARSPETVNMVRKASFSVGARITVRAQRNRALYAPSRVEVVSESDERIEAVAQMLGIAYLSRPPGRTIASVTGSVDEYREGFTWSSELELDWDREDFDPDFLRFGRPATEKRDIRLSRYQDPVRSIWRYRLYQRGEFAEVDADWGRYTALAMLGKKALRYDAENRSVLVPLGAPLPPLLSRALGLCSGYAPKIASASERERPIKTRRYELYQDVPPSVYQLVADKTGRRAP